MSENNNNLPPKTVVDNRFVVVNTIDHGSFGTVYKAFDRKSKRTVAMKLTTTFPSVGYQESRIMQDLQDRKVRCIPQVVATRSDKSTSYIAMKLLGASLSRIRRSRPDRCLSKVATLQIGMAMNECLAEVHKAGYIHRDVKPSNFAITLGSGRLNLLDFGIARRYRDVEGDILPPRENPGFRGSVLYASVHAHESVELSQRDDYWSLIYTLLELFRGMLPWEHIPDRALVGKMKRAFVDNAPTDKSLPKVFAQMVEYVKGLEYGDYVDNLKVRRIFQRELAAMGVKSMVDPFMIGSDSSLAPTAPCNMERSKVASGRHGCLSFGCMGKAAV